MAKHNHWIELTVVLYGMSEKMTVNVNSIMSFKPYQDNIINAQVFLIDGKYIDVEETYAEIKMKIFVGDTDLY